MQPEAPRDAALRAAVVRAARLRLSQAEVDALAPVQALREALARDGRSVAVRDFGAGTRAAAAVAETHPPTRTVRQIYRRAALRPAWGRFLFGLARALRPRNALELGTNLGVGAATLQAALAFNGDGGRLTTLEGDPELAALAYDHLKQGPGEVPEVVVGRFQDELPGVLERRGPFDLVWLDGHHDAEAVAGYLQQLRPHLDPHACVVVDDTEPWKRVRPAWTALRAAHPGRTVDFLKLGLWFAPDQVRAGAVKAEAIFTQ